MQGWRIDNPAAGGGVIADITVHDADTARFLLGETPATVVAQKAVSGMGRGVEDSAMSVWTMPSGAMVMAHESFTHRFAGTGLEVHGTEGSIIATGVMTQRPVGRIELVTERGREEIGFSGHDLYVQGVADFAAITQLTASHNVLVVGPSFTGKSLADLVAQAKANPGRIDYASSGVGSMQHLAPPQGRAIDAAALRRACAHHPDRHAHRRG
jgi:predicted dehydrogenase